MKTTNQRTKQTNKRTTTKVPGDYWAQPVSKARRLTDKEVRMLKDIAKYGADMYQFGVPANEAFSRTERARLKMLEDGVVRLDKRLTRDETEILQYTVTHLFSGTRARRTGKARVAKAAAELKTTRKPTQLEKATLRELGKYLEAQVFDGLPTGMKFGTYTAQLNHKKTTGDVTEYTFKVWVE